MIELGREVSFRTVGFKGNERLGLGPAIVDCDRPGQIDPVAIRKLELAPQEAFLLSRIEGEATVSELGLMCGLDLAVTSQMVERLVRLRVVVLLDTQRRTAKTVKIPAVAAEVKKGTARGPQNGRSLTLRQRAQTRKMQVLRRQMKGAVKRSQPADQVPLVSVSVQTGEVSTHNGKKSQRGQATGASNRADCETQSMSGPTPEVEEIMAWEVVDVDETKLDKGLIIKVERQRVLLQMTSILDTLTPFELLAISYTDDLTVIRRAFHQQSRWLHPDVYHGKDLGPYRELLEQLFTRVRQAYSELQSDDKRQQYAAVRAV